MNFSEREKRLVLITLIVGAVGLSLVGWKFLSSEVTDTTVSEATAERFDDLFIKIKNVEAQKSRNALIRKKLGNEQGDFIKETEVSNFVAEIEQVAGNSGVGIKNWDPTVNKRTKPLAQLDLKVSLECQFDQLIQFLRNIRKAKYVCQPTDLKTKLKDPNQPNLDVTMTLTTYLLESQPVANSSTLVQR